MAGIGLRIGAASAMALMAATVKLGATSYGLHPVEMLGWRFIFALPLTMLFVATRPGGLGLFRTGHKLAHVWRGVLGMVTMGFAYWSLMLLPLAEATALSFAAPLFATILAALLLADRVGWHRWSAIVLGFAGVLFVMQPQHSALPAKGLAVAVVAAFLVACVNITIRQISRYDPPETTVLWFTTISALCLGCVMPFVAEPHTAGEWLLIVCIALFGGTAQMLLTASLSVAPVPVVAPFDYTQLVWAVTLGWIMFGDLPPATTWTGAAIIVASGLYVLIRERRSSRIVRVPEG
ncbi:DMT family transporter [uncultured Parasphingopyxis sp.]|uniref:DMT family transporter n=1 Tax=uncultured Parasphingopyxis sp. TaxID=1547918 RepID=UPI002626B901|nr:DMT family transporter [uncultured Parasphingopyxis sp.]